jgi:hypothetical protein
MPGSSRTSSLPALRATLARLVAAVLIVVFPAITTAMPLAAPAGTHAGTSHAGHGGHHKESPHQQPSHHQQCCDLCGAACVGCAIGGSAQRSTARLEVLESASFAARRAVVEPFSLARLLPFPLGPPALLG